MELDRLNKEMAARGTDWQNTYNFNDGFVNVSGSHDQSHLLHIYFALVLGLKANNVLEIGVNFAESTKALLNALSYTDGKLYSIEIRRNDEIINKIKATPYGARWEMIIDNSNNAYLNLQHLKGKLDMLLIDGFHSFNQVKADYENYSGLVRPGGYILFHDTVWAVGVKEFFDQLNVPRKISLNFCNGLGMIEVQ